MKVDRLIWTEVCPNEDQSIFVSFLSSRSRYLDENFLLLTFFDFQFSKIFTLKLLDKRGV